MPLNSNAEAQGARADQLYQQAYGKTGEGSTDPQAPAPGQPASPQQAATPQPQRAPVAQSAAPAVPTAEEFATLQHKYSVLEGKYRAEVPRLTQAAQAAADAATAATRKATELQEQLAAAQNAQPLVTPEEVTEFGEPLVNLARRIAQEEMRGIGEQLAKVKGENEQLRAQVGQTAQVGAQLNTQAFYSALAAAQPDWEQVNVTPEWLKWLDGVDALTSRRRQELLDAAQEALDAPRVAAFFAQFKGEHQQRAATRSAAMEEQLTPDTSASGGNSGEKSKQIWTPALIAKFYDDVRRKVYTPADAERIELDIQASPKEGRYRPR